MNSSVSAFGSASGLDLKVVLQAELQARQVTIDLEAVKDSDPVLAGPVSELLVKVKASVLSLEIPVPVTILAAHRVRRTDDMFLLDTKEAADWLRS